MSWKNKLIKNKAMKLHWPPGTISAITDEYPSNMGITFPTDFNFPGITCKPCKFRRKPGNGDTAFRT
jgi:hypothetical protein